MRSQRANRKIVAKFRNFSPPCHFVSIQPRRFQRKKKKQKFFHGKHGLFQRLELFHKMCSHGRQMQPQPVNNTQYINNEMFKGEKQSTAVALANTTGP